jgi:Ca-activated chloride channel homolog
MKRSLIWAGAIAALLAAVLLSQTTAAQTTAALFGTVSDSNGAAVAYAPVQLRLIATGRVYTAATNQTGQFRIAGLPPGEYELIVQVAGFQRFVASKVQLSSGQQLRRDVKLEIASPAGSLAEKKTQQQGGQQGAQSRDLRELSAPSAQAAGGRGGRGGGARAAANGIVAFAPRPLSRQMAPPPATLHGPGIRLPNGPANTAQYDDYVENEFSSTASDPLSTFGVDVDTASYSNVRRFLNEGHLPPAGSVRIEELVNYFTYDYPLPENGKPVSMTTRVMSDPWNPERQLFLVGLRTQPISEEGLPPSNLTFLIDVSGSMMPPERLPLIREGLKMLARQLRAQDRVSLVVYAGAAGVVLPPTPGDQHDTILRAIDRLEAGGSTNGAAGIRLAYQMARQSFLRNGNNRVILATDGDFNVGVSSDDELVRMIETERQSGVFLSVLGVGTDNLKDSRMEKLADHGNGNYAYLDSLGEARKVLVQQMGATLVTVAKDVKLQIEFNPAHVKAWRLVGYENRVLRPEEFNDDQKDAGDLGAGHQVTAIYELIPAGSSESPGSVDKLRYQQDAPAATRQSRSGELAWVKLRHKRPQSDRSELLEWPVQAAVTPFQSAPRDARFATAVAEYGMLLRQSKFSGNASFDHALKTASESLGPDLQGYRAEFLNLVRQARELSRYSARE